MKFNHLGAALAGLLLALGVALGASAGTVADADSDGVPDDFDNCTLVKNGSDDNSENGSCAPQFDVDGDGYGNACDGDNTQGGSQDINALNAILAVLNTAAPLLDQDCNGSADINDLNSILAVLNTAPGPSGLSCASPAATDCTD